MRPPSGPNSGPSMRIQPFGRTCQSQLMTVPSPSAAKISVPEGVRSPVEDRTSVLCRNPGPRSRSAGTTRPAPGGPPGSPVGWAGGAHEARSSLGIGFHDPQHQAADQRAERANEQPVAREAAEACRVRGRRPCLSRDEGAPAAVGLHPDVEGDLDVPGVSNAANRPGSTCGAGSSSVTAFHGCTTVPNTISWPGHSPRSRKPARSMSSRVNGGREDAGGRPFRNPCSRLGRLRIPRSTRITAERDRSLRRTACHVRSVSASTTTACVSVTSYRGR